MRRAPAPARAARYARRIVGRLARAVRGGGTGEGTDTSEDKPFTPADLVAMSEIVGVLTPPTAAHLRTVVPVTVLVPGSRAMGVSIPPGSALVVERDALRNGPFSGAEAATGTGLLLEILDWFADARRAHVPVVLLDSRDASNVGTNLLRAGADVVLPLRERDCPALGPIPRSRVFTVLDQCALVATGGEK